MSGRGASSGTNAIAKQIKEAKKKGLFPKTFPGNNYRKEQKQALEAFADNWNIPAGLKAAKFSVNDRGELTMTSPSSRIPGNAGRIGVPQNATSKEMQGLKVFLAQNYLRKSR